MNTAVHYQLDGELARITLNRPQRHNALVPELLDGLRAALARCREDRPAALILDAEGRSFSTGGDVGGFYDTPRAERHDYASRVVGTLNAVILDLLSLPLPTVAAVHGMVTGGSVGLVLACDIVVAGPRASFAPWYTRVGYSPDGGWTALMPERIGRARAWAHGHELVGVDVDNLRARARAERRRERLPACCRLSPNRTVAAARPRQALIAASLAFVAGFSTVFIALGASAYAIGRLLRLWQEPLAIAAGIVIIIMGLNFLGIIRIPFLSREARFQAEGKPASLAAAYVMGLAFAFGWTPCIGPVLGSILTLAGARDTAGEGAVMLAVYSAGLVIPFLLAAVFSGAFMRFLSRFRVHLGKVEKGMGALLVALVGTVLGLSAVNSSAALAQMIDGGTTTAYWLQTGMIAGLLIWLVVLYRLSRANVPAT